MHAQSIDISNFRRFELFRCRFDPRFTLLVGPNGSGKTSLLRAIHGCLASMAAAGSVHISGITGDSDVRRVHSLDPADEAWRTPAYPCRGKLLVDVDASDELLVFEISPTRHGPFVTDDQSDQGHQSYRRVSDKLRAWFDPGNQAAVPLIARYGATNSTGSSQPGALQKPFESKQDVWKQFNTEVVNITWLAQWFQYNELRALQEGKEPLVYRLTKQAVLSAIHAEGIRYVVRDNKLMLLHANQGWRPFDELSDGQRRIAALFCDLALRCASLNSQLAEQCIAETTGIVTIDELDLHLHPSWQRSVIFDLLRVFPKLQFIATSHSPFLLQAAFEAGQVVDMQTGEFAQATDTSIEDIAEGVMGVDQPQRSQRFLALKGLAARYLALLESPPSAPEELASVKLALDEAMAAFADDPASAAWLQQRRIAAGL